MPRPPADPDAYTMSFGEHLEELRTRLIHALVGLAVACVVTFYFAQHVVAWLVRPLLYAQKQAGVPEGVMTFKVTTGFTLYMKVGLIGGLVLASPWILYQLWRFIAAGLYPNERRVVLLLAPFSTLMTALGVLFTYHIMLPLALVFLIGFQTTYPMPAGDEPLFVQRMMSHFPEWTKKAVDALNGKPEAPPETQPAAQAASQPAEPAPTARVPVVDQDPANPQNGEAWIKVPEYELRVRVGPQTRTVPMPQAALINTMVEIDDYIDFVMLMGLGIVIAFQVPVLMLIFGWTGIIDPTIVSRYRKHYIFGAFIAAAILTPTGDPFNLTLLAVPLWLLFELGLIVMRIAHWRQKRRSVAAGEE